MRPDQNYNAECEPCQVPIKTKQLRHQNFRYEFASCLRFHLVDNRFSDVVLLCKDKRIFSHKFILSSISEFLKKIFEDSSQDVYYLNLPDVNSRDLELFLRILYTGETITDIEQKKRIECLFQIFEVNLTIKVFTAHVYVKEEGGNDSGDDDSPAVFQTNGDVSTAERQEPNWTPLNNEQNGGQNTHGRVQFSPNTGGSGDNDSPAVFQTNGDVSTAERQEPNWTPLNNEQNGGQKTRGRVQFSPNTGDSGDDDSPAVFQTNGDVSTAERQEPNWTPLNNEQNGGQKTRGRVQSSPNTVAVAIDDCPSVAPKFLSQNESTEARKNTTEWGREVKAGKRKSPEENHLSLSRNSGDNNKIAQQPSGSLSNARKDVSEHSGVKEKIKCSDIKEQDLKQKQGKQNKGQSNPLPYSGAAAEKAHSPLTALKNKRKNQAPKKILQGPDAEQNVGKKNKRKRRRSSHFTKGSKNKKKKMVFQNQKPSIERSVAAVSGSVKKPSEPKKGQASFETLGVPSRRRVHFDEASIATQQRQNPQESFLHPVREPQLKTRDSPPKKDQFKNGEASLSVIKCPNQGHSMIEDHLKPFKKRKLDLSIIDMDVGQSSCIVKLANETAERESTQESVNAAISQSPTKSLVNSQNSSVTTKVQDSMQRGVSYQGSTSAAVMGSPIETGLNVQQLTTTPEKMENPVESGVNCQNLIAAANVQSLISNRISQQVLHTAEIMQGLMKRANHQDSAAAVKLQSPGKSGTNLQIWTATKNVQSPVNSRILNQIDLNSPAKRASLAIRGLYRRNLYSSPTVQSPVNSRINQQTPNSAVRFQSPVRSGANLQDLSAAANVSPGYSGRNQQELNAAENLLSLMEGRINRNPAADTQSSLRTREQQDQSVEISTDITGQSVRRPTTSLGPTTLTITPINDSEVASTSKQDLQKNAKIVDGHANDITGQSVRKPTTSLGPTTMTITPINDSEVASTSKQDLQKNAKIVDGHANGSSDQKDSDVVNIIADTKKSSVVSPIQLIDSSTVRIIREDSSVDSLAMNKEYSLSIKEQKGVPENRGALTNSDGTNDNLPLSPFMRTRNSATKAVVIVFKKTEPLMCGSNGGMQNSQKLEGQICGNDTCTPQIANTKNDKTPEKGKVVKIIMRKYICSVCFQKFDDKTSFESHELLHIGGSPSIFTCRFCNDSLTNKDELRKHLLQSHRNIMYSCESCKKFFVNRAEFDKHNAEFHRA